MARRKKKAKRRKKARAKKRTKKNRKKTRAKKKTRRRKTRGRKTSRKKTRSKRRKTRGRKKSRKKRKPNKAFMKPMAPSKVLAAVIGAKKMPRTEVTKKIWRYIKKNRLQDRTKRIMINADAKLRKVFGGKRKVNMFEMTKWVNRHLKD